MIAALLAAAVVQAEPVLLPGFADLPVIAGDVECDVGRFGFSAQQPDLVCVETTISESDQVSNAYALALRERGWRLIGGASVVIYFQRDHADGGCDRLDMAMLADFAKIGDAHLSADQLAAEPAQVLLGRSDDTRCFPLDSQ